MNPRMHLDPYIGDHFGRRDEELRREMEALRLEGRLRKQRRGMRGSRLAALFSSSALPLLRRAGLGA